MERTVFEVIYLVVTVVAALIGRYLIPWLKEKVGAVRLNTAIEWVNNAVQAAEQIYGAGKGTDKKWYVTQLLKRMLISKKISITDEQLDALIEAAVNRYYGNGPAPLNMPIL